MMTKKNVVEPGRTPDLAKAGSFEKKLDRIVDRFEAKKQPSPKPAQPQK